MPNYISQIQTPDSSIYKIKDAEAARQENSVYYVTGSVNDTDGQWTGTISGLTEYYNGLVVVYQPKVRGSAISGDTTLNINNLGDITCYATSTAYLRTHYPANCNIMLVYDNSKWIVTTNTDVLSHTLTIGTQVFDGSADVVIPLYNVP